jgi:AhpD family alkylhydroperoxidase
MTTITTSTGTPSDLGPHDLVPAHAPRMVLGKAAPDFYKAMIALDAAAANGLDPVIKELVKARASQLNGCAYCVDQHLSDARKLGLTEQKLNGLTVWWETPFFTVRERAALALAEAVTRLGERGVPDEVYDEAARVFDEDELPRLIAMCITINAWNRIGVTTRMSPAARPDGV